MIDSPSIEWRVDAGGLQYRRLGAYALCSAPFDAVKDFMAGHQ
jgi:hypothetical protein